MGARIFIGPALALLGRITGLRVWHFVAGSAALALSLVLLAAPFWLAAQAASPALGLFGVLLSVLGYLASAAALVAAAMYFAGRTVIGRLRRVVAPR